MLGMIGGILGGLGQLAGGAASLFGGRGNDNSWMSYVNAQQDREFQRAAMQHGIRWKVEDAKAAGVHPIFALGAPPFSPNPTTVMADSGGGDSGLASGLSNMGQGLERAISATQTKPEREETVYEMTRKRQDLERGDLQNQLLRSQIAKMDASQIGPPGPAGVSSWGGQVNMPGLGQFEPKPAEVTIPRPGQQTLQGGPPSPYVRFMRHGGGLDPEPIKDSKVEDEFGAPLMARWLGRTYISANLGMHGAAPTVGDMRAAGFTGATGVYWHHGYQQWRPLYNNERPWYEKYMDWRNGVINGVINRPWERSTPDSTFHGAP